MNYLLDTNACIALINGKPIAVRHRFEKAIEAGAQVNVSTVAVFELSYGVEKSEHKEANASRLETFLAGPITLVAFEEDDAKSEAENGQGEVAGVGVSEFFQHTVFLSWLRDCSRGPRLLTCQVS